MKSNPLLLLLAVALALDPLTACEKKTGADGATARSAGEASKGRKKTKKDGSKKTKKPKDVTTPPAPATPPAQERTAFGREKGRQHMAAGPFENDGAGYCASTSTPICRAVPAMMR